MTLNLLTCQTAPFVADVTPQPGSLDEASTAGNIFQQQVERYLQRLLADLCTDLREINSECCVYQPPIIVATMVGVDFPNIGSNSAVSLDFTMPVTLGMHILSWTPLTDASSVQDLIIQILIVADNTVRVTMMNPTAGAVDPDPIDFQFIVATAEDT